MSEQILEELGLTKGEIAVYYSLIDLGPSTAGPISKKARVSSSKVYEILERLMDKGLVSFIIRNNRKQFEAAPPKRILDYLQEKETKIKQQRELAKTIIPSLELKQQLTKKQNKATVYKGIKGIKTAFMQAKEEAKKGDNYLGLFIPRVNDKLVPFFEKFTKEFCETKGNTLMLFNEPSPELDKVKKIKGAQVKLLPEQLRVPTEICIIGNNVLISNTGGKDFTTILIRNKETADSFKKHFDMLWHQETKTYRGEKGIITLYEEVLSEKKDLYILEETKKSNTPCTQQANTPKTITQLEKRLNSACIKKHRKEAKNIYPTTIWVFGSKVAHILWEHQIVFLIDNKEIAKEYKKNF